MKDRSDRSRARGAAERELAEKKVVGTAAGTEDGDLPIYIGAAAVPDAVAQVGTGGVEVVEETNLSGVPGGTAALVLSPKGVPPREEHPVLVYLASLSPGSRRTMRDSLEKIAYRVSGGRASATTLAWHLLRYQHVAAIRSWLAESYAPSTANKMLSAVKGVLKASFNLGYATADDYQRAAGVAPVRGTRLPPGRSIERGELYALFRVCAEDKKKVRGARDAAILSLLYVGGLRRAEVVALRLQDYDPHTLEIKVRGKGSKERINYAEGGADRALNAWLRFRGGEEGPLLLSVNKGGRIIHGEPMSDQAVYNIVKRRQKEAGVKSISPHDFRKTFVGDLLDEGVDLSAAQQLAGHADPRTTARYDRRGERAKRKAASHLHVPYFEEPGG